MFSITIANGATFVYRDGDLKKADGNNLMGFLINQEGIKEIIESLPISKYYAQEGSHNIEITKEQAFALYDLIINYHKNNKDDLNKKITKKYSNVYNRSNRK